MKVNSRIQRPWPYALELIISVHSRRSHQRRCWRPEAAWRPRRRCCEYAAVQWTQQMRVTDCHPVIRPPSRYVKTYPRREAHRPTLPPIRDIFGRELSEAVPPQQGRASASPQIAFQRLALTDDDRRQRTGSPAPGSRGHASSSHPQAAYYSAPGPAETGSHARTASVSAQRPYVYGAPPPPGQQHGHHGHGQHPSYPQQRMSRGEMPTGVYPYAAPQSQYPGQHMPVASSSRGTTEATQPERSAASRYECSYCHKGFTRPSSLKIHINTHTGERPFTCPHPGCGRSFSVQSNMRRHARVHERGSDSQADVADEDLDEGELSASSNDKESSQRKR